MAQAQRPAPDPNETVYQSWMRMAGQGLGRAAEFIPAVGLWNNLVTPNVNRLNAPANPAAAAAALNPAAGTPARGIVLEAPAASAAAPPTPANTQQFLSTVFPGVRVTGADRTPERNAEVNGATNSHHLTPGRAVDMAPIPGQTIESVAERFRAAGWTVHEALDETQQTNGTGPHWHIAASPPAGGAPAGVPSIGMGPQLAAPDPAALMAMVPQAAMIPQINLPDAPQLLAPEARPEMQLADREALLGPLREAMAITPRDQSQDAWERIQATLGGAAQGAGQAGPAASVAEILLGGGGGALQGFRAERGEQRDLNDAETEAQRQVQIALARMGYDIDLANLDTSNQNLGINWQSGEDTRGVTNQNALSADERAVQEILAQHGITAQNVGAYNQNNLTRAQVGIGGVQDQFSVRNQGALAGWQTNAQLQERERREGGVPGAARILAQAGIGPDPQTGEGPQVQFARQTASAIAAGNPSMVLNSITQALLAEGAYAQIVDEGLASRIEEAIRQERPGAAAILLTDALKNVDATVLREELAKVSTIPSVQLYLSQGTQ